MRGLTRLKINKFLNKLIVAGVMVFCVCSGAIAAHVEVEEVGPYPTVIDITDSKYKTNRMGVVTIDKPITREYAREICKQIAIAAQVSHETVMLNIQGEGGSRAGAFQIIKALLEHPGEVLITVSGHAYSAHAFIALAGDEVHLFNDAALVFHMAKNSQGMQRFSEQSESLRALNEKIAGYIQARAPNMMSEDDWNDFYSGEDVVKNEFDFPNSVGGLDILR